MAKEKSKEPTISQRDIWSSIKALERMRKNREKRLRLDDKEIKKRMYGRWV